MPAQPRTSEEPHFAESSGVNEYRISTSPALILFPHSLSSFQHVASHCHTFLQVQPALCPHFAGVKLLIANLTKLQNFILLLELLLELSCYKFVRTCQNSLQSLLLLQLAPLGSKAVERNTTSRGRKKSTGVGREDPGSARNRTQPNCFKI